MKQLMPLRVHLKPVSNQVLVVKTLSAVVVVERYGLGSAVVAWNCISQAAVDSS
jgi:hypothetical protein